MGQPYQIDGNDEEEISLWENSAAFRRLIYLAAFFALIVLYGFFLSYYLQAYQRQIDVINQRYQQETGTKDQLINDVLPKKHKNPVLTANPKAAAMINYKTLDDYSLVENTWQKRLNPNNIVPKTGFDAYYFDQKRPNQVVLKEHNAHIATKYYAKTFKGIDTSNFGAYWVGKVHAKEDAVYHIKTYGYSKDTKIFLDGRLIDDKSLETAHGLAIFLEQGDYVLEVQTQSSLGSMDMRVNFFDPIISYKADELSDHLSSLGINTKNLYFASVYEPNDANAVIDVYSKISEPYALILSSSIPVNWHIFGNKPQAIIYSNQNSTVSANASQNIIKVDFLDVDYNLLSTKNNCHCFNGIFSCSGIVSLSEQVDEIEKITAMTLVGGSGNYSSNYLSLPGDRFSQTSMSLKTQDYERQRVACQVPTSPINKYPANAP